MAYDATTGQMTGVAGSGDIAQAYLSGDIAKANKMISDTGMSETGALNAGANMGYTPADIAAMKSKGIVFAAAGTPAENIGWNTNAVSGQTSPTSPFYRGIVGSQANQTGVGATLNPNSVQAATAEKIGAPTPWTVTPDQTVEGRIASITNQNNPLMVQAQTQANEQSNARGLINSSMAVTAGQDAMYRAAEPIAAADAATAAKAAGYNADMPNQIAIKNADAANQLNQAHLGANTSIYNANLGAKTQLSTAQLNTDSQQKIAAMDSATRTQIQTMQNANSTLLNTNQQASQAFNQYVSAAANIQNNPNLDAANKTAALQTLWQTTQTQLQVLAHVSGLDLTGMLDMTQFSPIVTPAPTAAPVGGPGSGGIVAGEGGA